MSNDDNMLGDEDGNAAAVFLSERLQEVLKQFEERFKGRPWRPGGVALGMVLLNPEPTPRSQVVVATVTQPVGSDMQSAFSAGICRASAHQILRNADALEANALRVFHQGQNSRGGGQG